MATSPGEFYDYNCGYCRSAAGSGNLIAEDPNLRVVLKEFPILSNNPLMPPGLACWSARAMPTIGHSQTLYSGRGQVNKDVALAATAELSLRVDLELRMNDDSVNQTLDNSFKIAQALGISGTPTYIIGNEIIPGAIGVEELRDRVANMRACGQTQCS